MPLYEYKCHACNKTFEIIQKFSDEPLRIHDECGGELERLVSAPALQFKGTGWYVTDYAGNGKGGSSNKSHKDGNSEAKTESKSETTKETKSETKAESKPAAPSTDK